MFSSATGVTSEVLGSSTLGSSALAALDGGTVEGAAEALLAPSETDLRLKRFFLSAFLSSAARAWSGSR